MFNGKMKALTFSYDDGVLQDKRMIEIFNKYGMKGTFNLNSGKLFQGGVMIRNGVSIATSKPRASEIRGIYEDHEIAVHTLHHPWLSRLPAWKVVQEVEEDRLHLSDIAGYEVVGMAYPMGDSATSQKVFEIIRKYTGVEYARLTKPTMSFDLPTDPIAYQPSVYHVKWDDLFYLGQKFIDLQADTPQVMYVWGHAYEFDIDNSWQKLEDFCKMMSGKPDIAYCTNKECFCQAPRKTWQSFSPLLDSYMKLSLKKLEAIDALQAKI